MTRREAKILALRVAQRLIEREIDTPRVRQHGRAFSDSRR